MFNIKFILFGILVFLISLQSCTNEFESNGQNVCFETDVLPVLVSNCTQSGCHNDIDKEADLVINNYNEIIGLVKVGDYRASKLYQVLILPFGSARMPPSPYSSLTDEQIQTIALWIEQGALKDSCVTPSCDTTGVRFGSSIVPILNLYCNGCHSGANAQGAVRLDSYGEVKKYVNSGSFIGSIEWTGSFGRMPKNGSKLRSCEISKIKKWLSDGAPNN
ncbi:MAG: hypothetical protein IPH93_07960 [Saprospiraceae bacterium]|nr:hypothetical protein [Saprospiraceae bacterium]MBK7810997.1 hypothetical protein [Saprospiraceae bacterium]MBK9630600.1 hypothetical protein [Saprospiraceae bacterium]